MPRTATITRNEAIVRTYTITMTCTLPDGTIIFRFHRIEWTKKAAEAIKRAFLK